uniref:Uncharacterized protein n=1 Tax=Romanomermis culicivorax TaxID=13658 RepID=A0A915LB44_ROMCU
MVAIIGGPGSIAGVARWMCGSTAGAIGGNVSAGSADTTSIDRKCDSPRFLLICRTPKTATIDQVVICFLNSPNDNSTPNDGGNCKNDKKHCAIVISPTIFNIALDAKLERTPSWDECQVEKDVKVG